MNIDLSNRRALICGGSQGIGEAIAMQFAKSGAMVTLVARNEDNLKIVVKKIKDLGNDNADYITADFSDFRSSISKIQSYTLRNGYFDILINNTGGPKPGNITAADSKEFTQAFGMHVTMSHELAKLLLPSMIDNGFGRIINIISIGLKQPIDNLGVSNTIRGAMGSWAKTLAREVGKYGITVNNILPGLTNTERFKNLIQYNSKRDGISEQESLAKMIMTIPAGRLGSPTEIGYLATFLASMNSGFINGASIPIDGGYLSTI